MKGAYWDSEIKQCQVQGADGYPVYTRKEGTDTSYLACARYLLSEHTRGVIYPQFASHNAHTVTAILALADEARPPAARSATSSSSACTAWATRCTTR